MMILCTLKNGDSDNVRMEKIYFATNTPVASFLQDLTLWTSRCNKKAVGGKTTTSGFTIEEGPWEYRLVNGGKVFGDWYKLKDEASYQVILDMIKE